MRLTGQRRSTANQQGAVKRLRLSAERGWAKWMAREGNRQCGLALADFTVAQRRLLPIVVNT